MQAKEAMTMKFGEKLKQARIRADMTQEQVIKKIGVTRQSLSNWENDRTYPDLASVVKLSDLYQVSLDDLLREDMELRRQMEKQQERMKKLCSFLLSIAIITLGCFCLFRWMDKIVLSIAFSSVGIILIIAEEYLYARFLGSSPKTMALRIFTEVLWWVKCTVNYGGNGGVPGILLSVATIALLAYTSHRLWSERFVRLPMTAVTGFALALAMVFTSIPIAGDAMKAGVQAEVNPFIRVKYRATEVIQGPDGKIPMVWLTGTNLVSMEYPDEERLYLDGNFIYINQPEGANTKGVWEMLEGEKLYRITVEADDSVTFGCTLNEQVLWKYRLEPTPTMGIMIKDVLGTGFGWGEWYFADSVDLSGDLGGWNVGAKGKIRLTIPGDEPTVTIYEEYRDGDKVEFNTMVLNRDKKGNVEFERKTRPDGGEQTGIYRIPYEDGEFILILRFNK